MDYLESSDGRLKLISMSNPASGLQKSHLLTEKIRTNRMQATLYGLFCHIDVLGSRV